MILANSLFEAIGQIGLWGCIAIMFVCGAAVDVARRFMRHKERMAMIEAGMNPDGSERNDD